VGLSTSVGPLVRRRSLARPEYEGLFGLLLVAVILLSTLDETALAPVGRGLLLACFFLLTIVNAGAALGVYIAAALVFSVHHFEGQGSWVQRPDNIALLFLAFYLVAGRCFSRSAGAFGSTAVAVALLLLTTFIHLVAVVGMDMYWSSWFVRMFVAPLSLFVLLRRAALSPRELRALFLIVAILGVYLAAVSVLQALGLYAPSIPPWLGDPDFNPLFGEKRVGGVVMQPEWNALEVSLAFCVLLLRLNLRESRLRVGWLAGAGLCLLAIYFTYTRGAWLGLLMGGVPLFWQRSAIRGITLQRRALFVTGVLGFAAFVLFFPTEILQGRASDSGTMYFRFSVWNAGLRMVAEHPLIGVGFGQFAGHLPAFVREVAWIKAGPIGTNMAHNTTITVAGELGLMGLTLYLLVICGVFRAAREAAGTAWGQSGRNWVAGFTVVYFVNVQFITAHELIPNVLYFGILGAIAGMRGWEAPPRLAVGPAGL
jgi:O-antigen ligase